MALREMEITLPGNGAVSPLSRSLLRYKLPMDEAQKCRVCGANLALVGRLHRCLSQGGVKLPVSSPVNKPVNSEPVNKAPAVNSPVTKPPVNSAQADRKAYMRAYMAKRLAEKRAGLTSVSS